MRWKEIAGSRYTANLKGAIAKAKANAAQGIPEMIEIATNCRFKENLERKHRYDAKAGWYRYDSRFALPVLGEKGTLERYNVYHAELVGRHSADGKRYLYDIINIKKETFDILRKRSLYEKEESGVNAAPEAYLLPEHHCITDNLCKKMNGIRPPYVIPKINVSADDIWRADSAFIMQIVRGAKSRKAGFF